MTKKTKSNLMIFVLLISILVGAHAKSNSVGKYVNISFLPKKDFPIKDEEALLEKCKSRIFYYGIGVPVDYEKSRKCAFVENSNGIESHDGMDMVFGGTPILMMIYANGLGVPRNVGFAIQLAKKDKNAPEIEIENRIKHLQRLETKSENKLFDICDDAYTTFTMSFCTGIHYDIDKSKREKEIRQLTKNWTQENKNAFMELQKAANSFFESRVKNEIDITGTERAILQINEQDFLETQFKNRLDQFTLGKFLFYSEEDFIESDAELNKIYKEVLKESEEEQWGSVNKTGIINTQKVWLHYRDAWVEFGATCYPKVSRTSWKTWMTKERTKQLKKSFHQK